MTIADPAQVVLDSRAIFAPSPRAAGARRGGDRAPRRPRGIGRGREAVPARAGRPTAFVPTPTI